MSKKESLKKYEMSVKSCVEGVGIWAMQGGGYREGRGDRSDL